MTVKTVLRGDRVDRANVDCLKVLPKVRTSATLGGHCDLVSCSRLVLSVTNFWSPNELCNGVSALLALFDRHVLTHAEMLFSLRSLSHRPIALDEDI